MKLKIYSKDKCNYCVEAKRLCAERKIEYVEYNIDYKQGWKLKLLEDYQNDFPMQTPRTVPQIWKENSLGEWEYLGGYEDLVRCFQTST